MIHQVSLDAALRRKYWTILFNAFKPEMEFKNCSYDLYWLFNYIYAPDNTLWRLSYNKIEHMI